MGNGKTQNIPHLSRHSFSYRTGQPISIYVELVTIYYVKLILKCYCLFHALNVLCCPNSYSSQLHDLHHVVPLPECIFLSHPHLQYFSLILPAFFWLIDIALFPIHILCQNHIIILLIFHNSVINHHMYL